MLMHRKSLNRSIQILPANNIQYYHFMNELLMIRRSTTSTLIRDFKDTTIFVASMISAHEIKIVELRYREEEVTEAQ